MNSNIKDAYLVFLGKYLKPDPDALIWILGYATYVHAIDDIIDRDIPGDKTREEFILRTFEYAEAVYTNIFYLRNIERLRPLVKMASNTYMDSVQLENAPEEYKRKLADGLRCMGNEVILAAIEIVNDVDTRRKASMELREISWMTHHLADGTPV